MADRRITPARPDLAAAHLQGRVAAARYVAGQAAMVAAGRTGLRAAPSDSAAQDSELLFGENVTVYERNDGWAWVQAADDQYVGYVRAAALAVLPAADARIIVPLAPLFSRPDLKSPLRDLLPRNARVARGAPQGDYVPVAPEGFVHHRHLAPLAQVETDFVAVAEQFAGAPYVWGGKTLAGLDCSGLVQVALQAAGLAAPRDTDMMEAMLGVGVARDRVRRGDLIFWKGHMGVMLDRDRLLHANAFHMQAAVEPLAQAIARLDASAGPVTAIKRI